MKLNIKWFSITTLIIGTLPMLILFIWCSINNFGIEVVRLFESIHPNGGLSIIENIEGTITSRIPGIAINTMYAAFDSLIAGFAFSALYNFFISLSQKKSND
ncbi:MAG: hypothetical protein KA369_02665 [Spirochaetes bacterium]|nr:hypothetical protein [Spirochaetota bacterium]